MSKKAKGDVISTYRPQRDLRGGAKRRYLTGASVLYPDFYAWFVFLAALDVMLTWIILYFDGSELNALANWIIDRNGMTGVVCYKFVIVAFVLSMCELIGRRNGSAGRKLAQLSVVITAFPVVLALMELFAAKHSLARGENSRQMPQCSCPACAGVSFGVAAESNPGATAASTAGNSSTSSSRLSTQ